MNKSDNQVPQSTKLNIKSKQSPDIQRKKDNKLAQLTTSVRA